MKKLVEKSIEKLLMLEKLCLKTDKMYEEKQETTEHLPFSTDGIKIQSYLYELQDWIEQGRYSEELTLSSRQRQTLSEMMFRCNEMWKTRTAVEKGDLDIASLDHTQLDIECIAFIRKQQKINAIKHYRAKMKEVFREEKTLKESKEYVDALQERYERQAGEHRTI